MKLRKSIYALLVTFLFVAGCDTHAEVVNDQYKRVVETVSGEFRIDQNTTKPEASYFELKLNNRLVADDKIYGPAFIVSYFRRNEKVEIAVVDVGGGGRGCPSMYKIIDFNYKEKVFVSKEFGNCSEKLVLSYDGKKFMLTLPSYESVGKKNIWVYSNNKLETLKER